MKASDLPSALGEVRALTARYLSGTPEAFDAARQLLNYLLRITVMDDRYHLRFVSVPGQKPNRRTIGAPFSPVRLNDDRFLRLVISLSLDPIAGADSKLRVYSASFQYQVDENPNRWVFRYDYLRVPEDPHPASHLQVRSNLIEHECLPEHTPFERIHLPTARITLEAVIRLLAEQFRVPCNEDPEIWRPLLAESEQAFEKIAHRHISGPST